MSFLESLKQFQTLVKFSLTLHPYLSILVISFVKYLKRTAAKSRASIVETNRSEWAVWIRPVLTRSNDMVCLWVPLSLGKRGTVYWPQ